MAEQYRDWVLDGSMGIRDGMGCFCPVDGDIEEEGSVIFGLNFLSDRPPHGGRLIAVIHEDGNEAAQRFAEENRDFIERAREEATRNG